MSTPLSPHTITPEQSGKTLAAVLRSLRPGESWTQVKALATGRRVAVGGSLCMDPARRLKAGEVVEVLAKAAPVIRGERPDDIVIRHLDEDVVVVEKAAGISTVRHPAERTWTENRRELVPTLDDITQQAIAKRMGVRKHQLPRLRIVHRLDKETSGLVVFARSVRAERELGRQFKAHTVVRRYIAIVTGHLSPRTICTWLVRDRGDGRRGSGPEGAGKQAVTHVDVLERFPKHTALVCQLETGRTHQIRIHLAEAGHPVCGETVYNRRADGTVIPDDSQAPRLALHAAELGFDHPATGKESHCEMAPPADLQRLMERLRAG
ncbi:MAG TPA: RluA family pseudouridine synthase [Gemmataceae bacterium]|nr:RluA family pseudouridine synthase [Gemmataceae bacterium]